MQSRLQNAMDGILESKGIAWLTGSFAEKKEKYAEILRRTRPFQGTGERISFVCDRLNPLIFNDEEIIAALELCLKQGSNIRMIFHRGDCPQQAIDSLGENNQHLCKLWQTKKDNLAIYWSDFRLGQYFFVISGLGVLFEEPKAEDDMGGWALFERNTALAKEWEGRFNDYVQKGCQTGHLEKISAFS